MGYYPDMSSQAAAQGYFAQLVQQAIQSAPVAQRVSGQPLYVDIGNSVVPANGNVVVTPNLGGRGIVGVLVSWNSTTAGLPTPRATIAGSNFTIFNDAATAAANMFWAAIAA